MAIADALDEAGVEFLVMGGHAVRYYGLERQTADFDFHLGLAASANLVARLRATRLFQSGMFREEPGWRGPDFRRFQIGVLPGGKEEWLEFWFKNHLLPAFDELYARRELGWVLRRQLPFLSLPDLIRSKETERDDDWRDVAFLEECLDQRNFAQLTDAASRVRALSQMRSRRGFESALRREVLRDNEEAETALGSVTNPITAAWLVPSARDPARNRVAALFDQMLFEALSKCIPASGRHLALVEAVRIRYRQAAKAADAADKARFSAPRKI